MPRQPERRLPQAHRPAQRPGVYIRPYRRPARCLLSPQWRGEEGLRGEILGTYPRTRKPERYGRQRSPPSIERDFNGLCNRGSHSWIGPSWGPGHRTKPGPSGRTGLLRPRFLVGPGFQFPLLPRPIPFEYRERLAGRGRCPAVRNRAKAWRPADSDPDHRSVGDLGCGPCGRPERSVPIPISGCFAGPNALRQEPHARSRPADAAYQPRRRWLRIRKRT